MVNGAMDSHKVVEGSDLKFLNGLSWGCFELHMPQNVATSTPIFTTSLVVIPCQLSVWPGQLEPLKDHPSTVYIRQARK